ncbi:MAG: TetM/TetW/TetO/TetS family tetracycline resistance ribosomal protection protein [Firmicutes bacterium]|nr:TetM/TetW/TetO/TetS family tetracycline resistance ribosomal protection protein [Bacillota bacterium]
MKKITAGILAHVDAGKTTLSEALLYETGAIRKLGRVDHGNAFLDTDVQEKNRGITIFSKQARFTYNDTEFMLLDTPGHVDFSAEMERTLQVLDYALLVISGKDGVQGHTATLWKLLQKYKVPVFIFVNKMDLDGADKAGIMTELRNSLDQNCVDFTATRDAQWLDQLAVCDEALLEEFLETDSVKNETIAQVITARRIFPCFFGSALKLEGMEMLLDGLSELTVQPVYKDGFGAKVYKITRDEQGNRLTHMKITGGTLHTKDMIGDEKAEQIRIYSGSKYITADHARGGDICAVTGLKKSYAGQGLGFEKHAAEPVLESVLIYQVILPPEADTHTVLTRLKQLEEEDPQLHVIWNEQLQEIQMQLMGEVQTEILKTIISDRFGFDVEFGQGRITYRETIASPVVGAGHFEPLRHYAEVQLLLEPGERGSGIVYDTACSEDVLDRNWQRLIMTHLMEKEHIGVLTGSPVTDMKVTILTGRAHLKHTEGGDFRQATYRAVRQGLRKAESVLLEPWYEFRLEVPSEMVGRAMSDVQKMGGSFSEPQPAGDFTILTGKAPVSEMKDYSVEVVSYTKGHGHLSCSLCGYEPCHNQEQVIEAIGYDPDRDVENTADSVFCSHGAGYTVNWNEVDEHLHTDSGWSSAEEKTEEKQTYAAVRRVSSYRGTKEEDAELDRIFEMTYGRPKKRTVIGKREITAEPQKVKIQPSKVLEEYLLVDGYNIIFAWDQLKELARVNMDSAREALIEILSNYQGYKNCHVIVVFDAYRIKGGERRFERHENVDVVYTKEAETADMYIEKTAHEKSSEYLVRVATSDRLEQLIIVGNGAFKVSADEFRLEVEQADLEIAGILEELSRRNRMENRNGIVIPEEK